ncbi:MAG: aminotransferase class V-fold PLP-dependent enzyme [Clostridiales bacterium]|jgi:selenocysteine lyase/cysteine desulfurase|nr:aminotransferase class V-fold PLP-dependent enzyme [Clostridiales bacterium]
MIYLDCAATSLQKPQGVAAASCRAINHMASPGRGSHRPAMDAADCVLNCRLLMAEYFNVNDPDKVIFTINATHALNIAVASLVDPGDKVVISGYEHNAVLRPLTAYGADIVVARSPLFDPAAVTEAYRQALPGAKCAVINHVSNVFGFILPIEEISALCHEFEVPLIIDASQSAGVIPIDFTALGAAFIAMPGHKSLLGPQGTGVLLCNYPVKPVLFGGTGSNSLLSSMPDYLPDRLEAGTHNVAGIAGLTHSLRYLMSKPPRYVLEHETALRTCFERRICDIDGLTLYSSCDPDCQSGVLSVVSQNPACDELAEILGSMGICVRSGLHCAPLAHETAGTTETGTVRFSFSPFNTCTDVFQASEALKKIFINR